MELLSLAQTEALNQIVESGKISELEELVAQYGYDEGEESDFVYQTIEINYKHRVGRLANG